MGIPWQPSGRAAERILAYGAEGSGKSFGAGSIARRMPATSTMYVIDTDHAWKALAERVFADLPIVGWNGVDPLEEREGEGAGLYVFECDGWEDTAKALTYVWENATIGDWVVFDSSSDAWDDVADYFTQQIVGKDMPKFILDWRVGMEKINQGDKAARQGTQGAMMEAGLWDYVNPSWHQLVSRPFKACKAHVYVTAQATTINPKDGGGIKGAYDSFGFKPRTQKKMGNNAATIVLMGKTKLGKREYTIVKNWGRETEDMPRGQVYDDLAKELLFKFGWRPARKSDA